METGGECERKASGVNGHFLKKLSARSSPENFWLLFTKILGFLLTD